MRVVEKVINVEKYCWKLIRCRNVLVRRRELESSKQIKFKYINKSYYNFETKVSDKAARAKPNTFDVVVF